MSDIDLFEVEPPVDILAAIPPRVLSDDMGASARLILLLAFSLKEKPSKGLLMRLAGINSDKTWQKVCREMEHRGWLIRKNHGSAGRGKWRHERTFLRKPIENPLL